MLAVSAFLEIGLALAEPLGLTLDAGVPGVRDAE